MARPLLKSGMRLALPSNSPLRPLRGRGSASASQKIYRQLKYPRRGGKRHEEKTLALLVALVLVVGCVIGATLAWLTASTNEMKNTFSTSDIEVTLTETEEDYKMVPGWTIHKDPTATITAGSEECYLFVKLDKSPNFDEYMACEIADGWTALENVDGVYYRVVNTTDMGTSYSVLKNDQVAVKDTVTREMMAAAEQNKPTFTVTAYASQLYKNNTETFTAADAWANISKN